MTTVHMNPLPLSPQAMADLFCTIIILCRGTDTDGKDFWAYLCIKPSMAQTFREAREKGDFDLEDYGTIIEMGDGTDVPPEIMQRMERDYGVNHHYEDELFKAAKAVEESTA